MNYKELVERIEKCLKHGDVSEICKSAGYISTNLYYSAIKKESWDDLSKGEEKVMTAAVELLASRQEAIKKVAAL